MRYTLWGLYQYRPDLFDDCPVPPQCEKEILIDVLMEKSGMLFPSHQQPDYFKKNITNWFTRRQNAFERMFRALEEEYSPIENYDRQEEWTDSPDLTKTLTGGHKNENEKNGGYTEELRKSGNVKDILNKMGAETQDESWLGGHKNTYDSDEMSSNENKVSAYNGSSYQPESMQTGDRNASGTDTFTYNGEQKNTITAFDDRTDERTTIYNDYSETRETSHPNGPEKSIDTFTYQNETEKQQGTTTHTGRVHGNIGVTTAQKMIEEELSLRRYDIYNVIAELFETEFLSQIY